MKSRLPKHIDILLLLFLGLSEDDVKESFINYIIFKYDDLKSRRSGFIATIFCLFQISQMVITLFVEKITWSFIMFKNYLKTAVRNLWRHKGYSFINIVGLSVGLACSILIFLWVQNELSYDRYHKNGDNIFRILRVSSTDPTASSVVTPLPLVPAIKEKLPEVVAATRLTYWYRNLFRYEEKTFYEDAVMIVDEDFFSMFSFSLIRGNPAALFPDPYSVVITEDMAAKYFGKEDPVGKVFTVNNQDRFTVTGVVENPKRTHLRFSYAFSYLWVQAKGYPMDEWGDVSYLAYLQLQANSRPDGMAEKISAIMERHVPEYSKVRELQPLAGIYYQYIRGYVITFSAVALIILAIACINFTNLSTARSGYRVKEIGMRKVAGARRFDLIKQFLGESFFLTLLAAVFGILLVALFLPSFETLTGRRLALDLIFRWDVIAGLGGIVIATGLFSGMYPALFFSAMQPVANLKELSHKGRKGARFRKRLVVLQFTLSIVLIVCTLIVSQQLQFLRHKDLGYDKENLVYISLKGGFETLSETIKHELLNHPNIQSVTLLDRLPNMYGWGTDSPNWEGKQAGQRIQFSVRSVDPDFAETFGVTMAEGRFFSEEFSTDDQVFVLNEAAVEAMGMESPVGKWFGYDWVEKKGPIVGIVRDFHFVSLHNEIEPLILLIKPDQYRYMCFKIASSNIDETIGFIEHSWKEYAPEFPFEYRFLDQSLDQLYTSEQRSATLIRTFSIIAILISCLGLLGMVSYILEHKTKEIGIRKTLGASVPGIVLLFTQEFVKWVVLANLLAWPIAYVVMSKWLEDYPYRTTIHWWIFGFSGISVLAISLLTIGSQVIKAALANPVDSLRYE